ncbi:hypothetical protein LSAT2_009444, partial [Lamellibrachia satsuma]
MIRRLKCTSFSDDVVELCGRLSQMSVLPQTVWQLMQLRRGSVSLDLSQLSNILAGLRFTSLDFTMQHMSLRFPKEEFQHLCRCLMQLSCSDLSLPGLPRRWTPGGRMEKELHYLCGGLRENCILDVPADINDLCVQMRTLYPHSGGQLQYGQQ